MKYFSCPKLWPDSTVFVIGGGPSLRDMDWTPFQDGSKKVVGVNSAYRLGSWVNAIFFGDKKFWEWNHKALDGYRQKASPGWVITHCENLGDMSKHPFLKVMKRNHDGMSWKHPDSLGWMGNSGISTINLAVHLGAVNIILLGFDGGRSIDGRDNWHDYHKIKVKNPDDTYLKIRNSFNRLKQITMERIKIINATPGTAIKAFPVVNVSKVLHG